MSLRENALGVNAWTDTAPVITSHRAPGQGRFSVADPRVDSQWQADVLGVQDWQDTSGVVAGRSGPTNGAYSVADPRGHGERASTYGVKKWADPAGTVAGESFPTNGAFSVADPRAPSCKCPTTCDCQDERNGFCSQECPEHNLFPQPAPDCPVHSAWPVADPRPAEGANATYQQYGVKDWRETASTVSGQSAPGGGAHSIADPRLGRKAHSNVYRVVPFDRPAVAVTSSRDGAVADPRPAAQEYASTKYQVTPYDRSSRTVIGASTTGDGAFAVADPRPNWGNQRHQNILRVTPYEEATGTISGGGHSVTGGQPCVADARREHYQTGGHYGVVPWERAANAVSGSACHDNGFNSVADPRPAAMAGEPILLPKPDDRLVCRIIAQDGTWHRPFTTLDLGALQALFDPEEIFYQEQTEFGPEWRCRTPFDLEQGSDVTKREWIGNMVPGAAATGMAETIGEALILADMGESFFLSTREIWVKPGALALSIDNDQTAFAMDCGGAAA